MPELLEQKNIPDEQGFKRTVEHAIVNFRHSDVRKAVLSVQRELLFAQDVDVSAMQNNLRAQNPGGYHFRVPMPDGATLIGVSPELLVHKDGLDFVSNPWPARPNVWLTPKPTDVTPTGWPPRKKTTTNTVW